MFSNKELKMHIRNYLAALEFVNEERGAAGLEPLERLPAGRPGDARDCAIARAIPGASVGVDLSLPRGRNRALPSDVLEFVSAFDGAGRVRGGLCDPGDVVEGGIDDEKGCLVPA